MNDQAWALMRDQIANMADVLRDEVEDACPGPHACQQRRDGQRPWCQACGRTADGQEVTSVSTPRGGEISSPLDRVGKNVHVLSTVADCPDEATCPGVAHEWMPEPSVIHNPRLCLRNG